MEVATTKFGQGNRVCVQACLILMFYMQMDDGDENHEEEQENVDLQLQDRLIILIARSKTKIIQCDVDGLCKGLF